MTMIQIIGLSIPLTLIVVMLALLAGAYLNGRSVSVRSLFSSFVSAFKDEPVEGVPYTPSRLPDVKPKYTDVHRGEGIKIEDRETPNSVLHAVLATPPDTDEVPSNEPTAAPFYRQGFSASNLRPKNAMGKSAFASLRPKDAMGMSAFGASVDAAKAFLQNAKAAYAQTQGQLPTQAATKAQMSAFSAQDPVEYGELEVEQAAADADPAPAFHGGSLHMGVGLDAVVSVDLEGDGHPKKEAFPEVGGAKGAVPKRPDPIGTRQGGAKSNQDLLRPSFFESGFASFGQTNNIGGKVFIPSAGLGASTKDTLAEYRRQLEEARNK